MTIEKIFKKLLYERIIYARNEDKFIKIIMVRTWN